MPWTLQGCAIVSRKGARRLRAGHPWVYLSDVLQRPGNTPGLVEVLSDSRERLGEAFYSPASTITLRLVTHGEQRTDRALIAERLVQARQMRQRALPDTDVCRLVHGEADLLPGIFIDRYGDCLALQTTCAAADRLEGELVDLLVQQLGPRAVVLRDDAAARGHEGLRRHVTLAHGEAPVHVSFDEGQVRLSVDLLAHQKTGAYLDQRQNHLIAARYAHGTALDCFTYHGGFALQMARICESVVAYDQSDSALDCARANAERTGLLPRMTFERANVFTQLPALLAAGRRFNTIVLDPPAFASTKKTEAKALRGYKEINLRAMKLLEPGGVLITCSCSGRIDGPTFDRVLAEAALDARRPYLGASRGRTRPPSARGRAGDRLSQVPGLACQVA
jgi:23S rRNA (cytosine1962-C5)-methyltransferase